MTTAIIGGLFTSAGDIGAHGLNSGKMHDGGLLVVRKRHDDGIPVDPEYKTKQIDEHCICKERRYKGD